MDVFPPEQTVGCGCDFGFHLPVGIDPTGYALRVNACTHCGTVSVTTAMCDELRPGDFRHNGNRVEVIERQVLDWLGQWPRLFITSPREMWYLPAMMRCETLDDLHAAEHAARAGQSTLPEGRRLRLAGPPPTPAPAQLTGELHAFQALWDALQLSAHADLEKLIALAQPGTVVTAVGVDLLLCKPDLPVLLPDWLRSEEEEKRNAAHEIVKAWKPVNAAVLRVVVDDLMATPLDDSPDGETRIARRWRIEQGLRLLRGLGANEPWLIASLEELKARFVERDPGLYSSVAFTITTLSPAEGERETTELC